MPPRLAPVTAAALTAAALAAGCAPTTASNNSAGDFRGEQRLVAQTVEDLQSAAADGNQNRICTDLLARSFAGRLAARGRGCAPVVDAALKDTDSFDMTVQSVRISGTRATARVKLETGTNDRTATVQLVREGGRWRIAGF